MQLERDPGHAVGRTPHRFRVPPAKRAQPQPALGPQIKSPRNPAWKISLIVKSSHRQMGKGRGQSDVTFRTKLSACAELILRIRL